MTLTAVTTAAASTLRGITSASSGSLSTLGTSLGGIDFSLSKLASSDALVGSSVLLEATVLCGRKVSSFFDICLM